MIHKIFSPKIDYLEIGIRIEKPIIFRSEDNPLFYEVLNKLKELLDFKEEHKTEFGSKELYIFNGKNLEIRNKSQKVIFKGEAFYSQKQWIKIKMLVKILDFYKVDWYLKRIDIRRNYIADSTIDPLQDLKNGFWINRASSQSFFQPELYRKTSKNVGTYFKSDYFNISSYDKSEQIKELENKINNKKTSKKNKERFKKTVFSFYREHKNKKDPIKRFELKILKKSKANNFINNLRGHWLEKDFCYSVLKSFYESHPMKNKKVESNNFKSFFMRGGD